MLQIIYGPTASGKSKLAIELAKKCNGAIISADSRQIYKYMDIGTGQITLDINHLQNNFIDISSSESRFNSLNDKVIFTSNETIDDIPIYLTKIIRPNIIYSVSDFQRHAITLIKYVENLGMTPIIVGGTGLYLDSLWNGYDYGNDLQGFSSEYIDFITPNVTKDIVYENINSRVTEMFVEGWLNECIWLKNNNYHTHKSLSGAGYSEIFKYLSKIKLDGEDDGTLDYLVRKCCTVYRNYAKRQYTWFKKYNKFISIPTIV